MLERLFIITHDGCSAAGLAALAAEFPTVEIGASGGAAERGTVVDATAWAEPSLDLASLDRRVDEASREGAFGLRVAGGAQGGFEILTRYQRFVDRRNRASASAVFDAILDAHRALHDLGQPLCRADHDHAIDTWQWLLRLTPAAGLALQVAALFHDVERLESEARVRVEHHASSYLDFKEAHARRGAEITRAVVARLGLDALTIARIGALIETHERPRSDLEGVLLAEADALSFFSQNSSGFLDYYGDEHTRRKVAYTLARLRPEARHRLRKVRLRADVQAILRDVEESESRLVDGG